MKQKLIGLYELITGIFGVILLVFSISKVLENRGLLFTYFLGLILFAGVAFAGYALLNNLKNAKKYSIIAQALQIIGFTGGSVQYIFSGSAFLALTIDKGVHIQSQIAPIAFNISSGYSGLPFELKIFLIPVLLVVLLAWK